MRLKLGIDMRKVPLITGTRWKMIFKDLGENLVYDYRCYFHHSPNILGYFA